MKAIVLEKNEGTRRLVYTEDREKPKPAEDEILVKVRAVGLNPVDYKLANSYGDFKREKAPVLGLDVVGIVEEKGGSALGFNPGDRVYGHGDMNRVNGGFAEYACLPAYALAVVPESVGDEEAALPCAGFTALSGRSPEAPRPKRKDDTGTRRCRRCRGLRHPVREDEGA
jgi:NADPH:quinone reductase-like Zn-dependent oxidoreductase